MLQDPCQNSPCENGGTCNVVAKDYECICPEEVGGFRCQCTYLMQTLRESKRIHILYITACIGEVHPSPIYNTSYSLAMGIETTF